MDFVGNLLLFPAVKEFRESVEMDKIIAVSFVYYFFWDTVYNFYNKKVE